MLMGRRIIRFRACSATSKLNIGHDCQQVRPAARRPWHNGMCKLYSLRFLTFAPAPRTLGRLISSRFEVCEAKSLHLWSYRSRKSSLARRSRRWHPVYFTLGFMLRGLRHFSPTRPWSHETRDTIRLSLPQSVIHSRCSYTAAGRIDLLNGWQLWGPRR